MKIILTRLLIVCCIFLVTGAVAQNPVMGTISYETSSLSKMNINGQEFEQKMNLNITLDFSGDNYKLSASMVPGGANGGTGIRISGAPQMFQYYVPVEKVFYQVTAAKGKTYAIRIEPKKITDFVSTGNTETMLGYTCNEFTCTYNGETATGWYSTALSTVISPVGSLGLPGGLIKLESKNYKYTATGIKTDTPVKKADLKLPDAAIKTTRENFEKEMANN
ncbi:MAG: GLPGLI family protein [Bacteroidota bacterium]